MKTMNYFLSIFVIILNFFFASCEKNEDSCANASHCIDGVLIDTSLSNQEILALEKEFQTIIDTDTSILSALGLGNEDTDTFYPKGAWSLYIDHRVSIPKNSLDLQKINLHSGKDYKINVHTTNGMYVAAIVVYNPYTKKATAYQSHLGNYREQATASFILDRFQFDIGCQFYVGIKALTNSEMYCKVYEKLFSERIKCNMTKYKHLYQNRLPQDYANFNAYLNNGQSNMMPFYTGSSTLISVNTAGLCALAAYMMSRNLVNGATGITNLKDTELDRAIQLAENRQRINHMLNNSLPNGGYSINHIYMLAGGTTYFKGDFSWPDQNNYVDCNLNGVYDAHQVEKCVVELINYVNNAQNAHNMILNAIINHQPVVAPVKTQTAKPGDYLWPCRPYNYLRGSGRQGHVVCIIGVDMSETGKVYYRYIDPLFDDATIWYATKDDFLASMLENSGTRYDMLIIKGR